MSFKKSFIASAMVLGAIGATSVAHAEAQASSKFYIGGSLGRTFTNLSDETAEALQGATLTRDVTGIGGKFFGGYNFDKNWAIESGYASLGNMSLNAKEGLATATAKAKMSSIFVAATLGAKATESLSIFGKAGVSLNHLVGTADLRSPNFSEHQSEKSWKLRPMVGFGMNYDINSSVALRTEYEYFGKMGKEGPINTGMISAGVTYKF